MDRVTRHRDVALPAGRKRDTSNNFDEAYVKQAAQALIDGTAVPPYQGHHSPTGYDPSYQTYVVQAGDTIDSIADDIFDTPTLAPVIASRNPGVIVRPGAWLKLPTDYNP